MTRTQQRSVLASPSAVASCAMRTKRPLLYESPRCEKGHDDDERLLQLKESLQTHQDRWNHMSQLAGSHKQDGSVLVLTKRTTSISPEALRFGIPPSVAARVLVLHLDLRLDKNKENNDLLPEWMDVLSSLFHQLQHLYLSSSPCGGRHKKKQHDDDTDDEAARMRRLYVLYRLPDLRSIDGTVVTEIERQLARPSTPNGHKVKRAEWISTAALMDGDDSDDDEESDGADDDNDDLGAHGEAIEVSLDGCIKPVLRVPSDSFTREKRDNGPDWEYPFEPRRVSSTPEIFMHGRYSEKRKLPEVGSEQQPEILFETSDHALVMTVCDSPEMNDADDSASGVSTCGGLSLPYLSSDDLTLQKANPCPRLHSFSEELCPSIHSVDSNVAEAKFDKRRTLSSLPFPLNVPSGDDQPRDESMETTDLEEATPMSVSPMDDSPADLPDNAISDDRVTGPSTSLSSPFPLQFRETSTLSNSAPPKLSLAAQHEEESLQSVAPSSTKAERGESNSIELWLGRDDPMTKSVISPVAEDAPLSSPTLLMDRPVSGTWASPDKIVGSRPPPCPASRRQVAPMRRKTKRGMALWRSRKTARSTSIIDNEDDDGATTEEEHDESEVFVSFLESSTDDEKEEANVFVSFREIALN